MVNAPVHILIVEDDSLAARLLKANLERFEFVHTYLAGSAEEALEWFGRRKFDAVVTDLGLPAMDGISLVRRIREMDPALPVIVITANATLEKAVEAIRAGATEFLQKPVNIDALVALTERAIGERPLREELRALQRRRGSATAEDYIAGKHPRLEEARRFGTRIASVPGARVLITGESGTGKSLLARAIHDLSGVRGRFMEVNCAALPSHLLESELFGHEKGAFTDAKNLKRGLIETAHEGTLLLDEIGAMPIETQAKLLLFLENQEIRRVGGTQPIQIRTRVLAATNEDLEKRVQHRQFRLDLLYRLDVTSFRMPALREMPSVVPELAIRFVREIATDFGRAMPELASYSFEALSGHAWPGNGRELRNVVERSLIFHDSGPLRVAAPAVPRNGLDVGGGVVLPLGLSLEQVEARYLAAFLKANDGVDQTELAGRLGIVRKTLWEKRRRHGL